MYTITKGGMRAGMGSVDDELICVFYVIFIAVARDIPHSQSVTLLDLLATQGGVFHSCTCHMGQRRLPTDDFRYHFRDQARVLQQLFIFTWILIQRQHTA